MTPAPGLRSYPEDFQLDDGNDQKRCSFCAEWFVGLKTRTACRICAKKDIDESALREVGAELVDTMDTMPQKAELIALDAAVAARTVMLYLDAKKIDYSEKGVFYVRVGFRRPGEDLKP